MIEAHRLAVLPCKLTGEVGRATVRPFFTDFFTPGSGGGFDYWFDNSFGNAVFDATVFDWATMPIAMADLPSLSRRKAFLLGVDAHRAEGHILLGFDRLLVYLDAVNVGGSAAPEKGGSGAVDQNVFLTRDSLRSTLICHELGHALGFDDAFDIAGTPYFDPFCMMSAEAFAMTTPAFPDPRFGNSGPSLASSLALLKRWLTVQNTIPVETNGTTPRLTQVELDPYITAAAARPKVAIVPFQHPFPCHYIIDYHVRTGWDRGLARDVVVIRRMGADGYPLYAGKIEVPARRPGKAPPSVRHFVDPSFDLAVRLEDGVAAARIRLSIGPAALVRPLSEKAVVARALGIGPPFGTRAVLPPASRSLRLGLAGLLSG